MEPSWKITQRWACYYTQLQTKIPGCGPFLLIRSRCAPHALLSNP